MKGLAAEDQIASVETVLRMMLWAVLATSAVTTMLFAAFLFS